jgi:hypothetical protein
MPCFEMGFGKSKHVDFVANVFYKRAARTSERRTPPNLPTSAGVYLNNVII